MSRVIIFGDIHGCHQEWQDLMDKLKVTSKDRLISVGDLICKGPSSRKTLDMAMSMKNLTCIIGNHELRFLRAWEEGKRPTKPYDAPVLEELGQQFEKYMTFISNWPHYIEDPEFLVIHGGLRPGVELSQQDPTDLAHLRTVPPDDKPWYEYYTAKRPVIFGHWAQKGLVVRNNAIGLDTGCVYGKKLSAVLLPEREIVSVPARKAYSSIG